MSSIGGINCISDPSEQAENPVPDLSPQMRARCLAVLFKRALAAVNAPADMEFPNPVAALQYALERAREHKMDPATYDRAYGIWRILRDHVISRNEASPAIVGEIA